MMDGRLWCDGGLVDLWIALGYQLVEQVLELHSTPAEISI